MGDCDDELLCAAVPNDDADVDADRHSVAVPDSDAIVADAEGVSRLGAQNGPILNVARCVPSIDSSGDAVAANEGDPDTDTSPVTIVGVTDTVTDTVSETSAVAIVGVTETVVVRRPVAIVCVTDCVTVTEGDTDTVRRPVAIVRVTDWVTEMVRVTVVELRPVAIVGDTDAVTDARPVAIVGVSVVETDDVTVWDGSPVATVGVKETVAEVQGNDETVDCGSPLGNLPPPSS